MSQPTTTIIITGANRGIGAALLHSLATSPPASLTPLTILACARNPPTPSPSSSSSSTTTQIHWHALDISSPSSITAFATAVRTTHAPQGVDILISNAGVNLDMSGPPSTARARAQTTLDTNFTGTVGMMQALAPLMRRPGIAALGGSSRIVNVSSVGGKLSSGPYGTEVAARIKGARTLEELEGLGHEYVAAVARGGERESGWPVGKSYGVSKALLNRASEVVAAREENRGVLVNFCCPGWCDSEMGRLVGRPGKTNEEGARVPLMLAVGDVGVTGKYWENPSVFDKGSGRVAEW